MPLLFMFKHCRYPKLLMESIKRQICDRSSYNVLIMTMRDAISYVFPACPW